MATTIFFNGDVSQSRAELWVSDGTVAGTHAVILPGEAPFCQFYPASLTPYDNEIYFIAYPASSSTLYKSDGTLPGTIPVLGGDGQPIYGPILLTASDDNLYFTTLTNNSQNLILYVSQDGSPPVQVPGANNVFGLEYSLTPYKDGVVFYGESGVYFANADGVVSLLTSPPAQPNLSGYAEYGPPLVPVEFGDNKLLLNSLTANFTYQLAVSDGTSAGTKQLIIPGLSAEGPQTSFAFAWGNRVVFDATTASNHDDLFVSDGTTGGTKDLSTALAGFANSISSGIVFLGKLLLAGGNAAGDAVLLLTDGTAAGTSVLATIAPTTSGFELGQNAVVAGPSVYFAGPYGTAEGLWESDGTAAGTRVLPVRGTDSSGLNPMMFASLDPDHTLYGDLGGRSVIQGASGADYITTYGASNTIEGNGGNDTIFLGSGGYSRVIEGSADDQASGTTTISLNGPGNVVTGGDEDFTVSGGTGFTNVSFGNGNNNVTLGGDYNKFTLGTGTNTISTGGGHVTIIVSGFNTPNVATDTIELSGQHNAVSLSEGAGHTDFVGATASITGGTGYSTFKANGFALSLVTDGLYNTVSTGSGNAAVAPGSGYDTVMLDGAGQSALAQSSSVTLGGTHNLVEGMASAIDVSDGSGSNTFLLNEAPSPGSSLNVNVTAGGQYNRITLAETNVNIIQAGSGADRVTVGTTAFVFGNFGHAALAKSTITFAGTNNALTASDAPTTVVGGDGAGTYALGNGNDTIMTGGTLNFISLGSGQSTVAPGSGSDTVVLNGSDADVQLQGSGDKVTLKGGTSGSINGTGLADLHLYAANNIGDVAVNSILMDPRTVITLTGGAGGYTTAAQAYAALTPDGSGGSKLAIGSGALDFAGAPASSLSSHMFTIAP